jgi:hypothetical protein
VKLAKNTYILLVVICSHEIRVNQTTSNSARVAINFDILIHSSIHLTLVTLKTPLVCRDRFVVCIPHFDRIQPLHDDDLSTINLSLFLLFIHLIPPHKVHKHKTNDCFFLLLQIQWLKKIEQAEKIHSTGRRTKIFSRLQRLRPTRFKNHEKLLVLRRSWASSDRRYNFFIANERSKIWPERARSSAKQIDRDSR